MCETVLKQVEEYGTRFPNEPALASVAAQLRYLIQFERGEVADISRLKELILGRYAVYELGNIISDDLSKRLCAISDGARRRLRAETRAR